MSSNKTNAEWESTSDGKRWYSIMFRVFLKVAQVVVQSRVNVSHMITGNEKKSNWFNVELLELPGIDSQVASVLGINSDRSVKLHTPIRIDIYVDLPAQGDSQPVRLVLERWSISLVQSSAGDSSMVDSLQAGYKKLVILLRSVYTQTRQLPLWMTRYNKEPPDLKYEISVVESVTRCEGDMAEFQFGSQYTPFGRLYVSVRYRTSSSAPSEEASTGLNPQLIQSEYFKDPTRTRVVRVPSAPIPIASGPQDTVRQRAFSAPTHAPIHEQAPGFLCENQEDVPCEDPAALVSPMLVGSYNPDRNFQPHSLPPRLPSRVAESLNKSIVGPALSDDGVARPMDIPVEKLRHVNSRSSLEDPLGSSRGTSPSSYGSSFGSSPYNMFGFTPPFAGATAAPIYTSSPPEGTPPSESCLLVFGETNHAPSRTVPISAFKVFTEDQEPSNPVDPCDSGTNAYSVFIEQQQQEFESENLPFADPAGPSDHDSKIGSFVEECWHAPALQMFSQQDGQRMSQSTQSLQEELFKLRDTKEMILLSTKNVSKS